MRGKIVHISCIVLYIQVEFNNEVKYIIYTNSNTIKYEKTSILPKNNNNNFSFVI